MAVHTTKKWYAVYTKPRWEKKVHRLLTEQQLESYCPLNKVYRKWSDRIKIVEEPLFKSYIFVRIKEEDKTAVRMTDGVVNFVYWLGKPAQIRNSEIETIKRFLKEYDEVEAIPLELEPNSKVRISRGVLMDREAIVKRVRRNRVEVVIESLGYALVANVDKSSVSVIGTVNK
jgi:transcription antitermination factor NusG